MNRKQVPIGLQLASTAKTVSRAFNDRLAEEGGSAPIWLILSSLKRDAWRTQLDLARSLGIEGPTLTRHLDGLEEQGLVQRVRDASDRRAVRLELTDAGDAMFHRLRHAVVAFNRTLTNGLADDELEQLRGTLDRLARNAERATRGVD